MARTLATDAAIMLPLFMDSSFDRDGVPIDKVMRRWAAN